MGRQHRKKARLVKASAEVLQARPAPHIEDHTEFPPLNDSLSPEKMREVSTPDLVDLADLGVLVDGTTYYMPPPAVSPTISLNSSFGVPTLNDDFVSSVPPDGSVNSDAQDEADSKESSAKDELREGIFRTLDLYLQHIRTEESRRAVIDNLLVYPPRLSTLVIEQKTTEVYMGRHLYTGALLNVRRIVNLNLRNTRAVDIAAKWHTVDHPNVMRLKSITTTRSFGGHSVLFAYEGRFDTPTLHRIVREDVHPRFDEERVWSYIVQLVCGLHAIHSAGLAARVLNEYTVVASDFDYTTLMIGCCGMVDLIEIADTPQVMYSRWYHGEHRCIPKDQHKDLVQLGKLVRFLVKSLEARSLPCSNELKTLADSITDSRVHTIDAIVSKLGVRILNSMSFIQKRKEAVETRILEEVHHGYLLGTLVMLFGAISNSHDSARAQAMAALTCDFMRALLQNPSTIQVLDLLDKLYTGTQEIVQLNDASGEGIEVSFRDLHNFIWSSANSTLLASNDLSAFSQGGGAHFV